MITGRLNDFHLVMARGMKDNLKDLDIYRESGSLSGVIVKILSLLEPVMNREHRWGEQRMSRYKPVAGDPDEVREDMHVYLPEGLYRRIKLMHADLNFFSIAQLVRGLLEFFIRLVKEYGDNVYQELKKWFSQWNEESEKNRLTPRRFMRQLLQILRHLPGENRLINVYNGEYTPFWVYRL